MVAVVNANTPVPSQPSIAVKPRWLPWPVGEGRGEGVFGLARDPHPASPKGRGEIFLPFLAGKLLDSGHGGPNNRKWQNAGVGRARSPSYNSPLVD